MRPVRVVPIVAESPCPFELLAPLLAPERLPPPAATTAVAEALAEPGVVWRAREKDGRLLTDPAKPLVATAPRRRPRLGVSDERAAQISEQIARNGQRLGIAKREKREDDPPKKPKPDLDDNNDVIELL